jgi:hypothetical protein
MPGGKKAESAEVSTWEEVTEILSLQAYGYDIRECPLNNAGDTISYETSGWLPDDVKVTMISGFRLEDIPSLPDY